MCVRVCVCFRATGGTRVRPRGQHRAHHDEPQQPKAVGPDRAVRPHRRRQPRAIVQARSLGPRARHHHHQRLLASDAVRGLVHFAVAQVRRPAPAAAVARERHGLVGIPRVRHHHDHGDQAGERARGMARPVHHRHADVPADRQRHIHQSDHIATVRQRK